jgi:ATP-binding cassette subfamily B multidrug efflux pump
LFARFENLLNPYPDNAQGPAPRSFFAFIWACSEGLRGYIAGMTALTACIGAFEALLFAMLGRIVDWLAKVEPARLWAEQGGTLLLVAGLLAASTLLVLFQTLLKHQTMAGNFPMRLRWNFHRLLLGQSMAFYQDEFAGRIATKVMQTALAVRDTWMIATDILVFVSIYFITLVAVVGSFDAWMLLPFVSWVSIYLLALRYFVPRLSRTAREQADARSLMTGRITDAYTNIATVKLFSHAGREAAYARSAMRDFLRPVHAQMRLVTGFEVTNHALNMLLVLSTTGIALWLWTRGEVGVGALAASTAMALRLNGISHWVMWEMAALFEHVGTVQDGINTFSRPHAVVDRPDARRLEVSRGEIRFEHLTFAYGSGPAVVEDFSLTIRPGEKIRDTGLRIAPSGGVLLRQNRACSQRHRGQDGHRPHAKSLHLASLAEAEIRKPRY